MTRVREVVCACAVALCAGAVLTGCMDEHCSDDAACAAGTTAATVPGPRSTTTSASSPTQEDERGRRAPQVGAIYAAVVRQLVTKDNTFGPGVMPFEHIFVRDQTLARDGRSRPLGDDVKALVARRLGDLPPLDFVSDPKSVIDPHRGCAVVREHGALITLGPISAARAGRVKVRGELFFACLGAAALTYVLEPVQKNWRVVGMVGGRAIS